MGFETDALGTLALLGGARAADGTEWTPLRETLPACSLVWSRLLAEKAFV